MSIQLNYSVGKKFQMIEYPGIVKNVDRMLTTLGGITKVSQAFSGTQKRLDLRFHPDNPYNKAAYGDFKTHSGLLLSIKVRRSKRNPSAPPQYQVRIIGYCERVVSFDSICDFQFLPLCEDTTSTAKNSQLTLALDSVMPKSVTDCDYFSPTIAAPLLCVPYMFARSDIVHPCLWRNDAHEDGHTDVLGVFQKSTYESREVVSFNMTDAFPNRPDPQMSKRMKVKYVSDEQLEKVKKLFDQCPVWTRIALLHESGVSNDKLKYISPSLAYYFSTGPWRSQYVRYGYDPRKDFRSRHYQTFDFRLRFRSGMAEFIANRKDSIKKKHDNPFEINELVQDVNYPYLEENKLPRSRQCILRYCDIRIPKIQEMLEKIPTPLAGASCNERAGWLPVGFDTQVRQIVSNSIKELLRNHHRKEHTHSDLGTVEDVQPEDFEVEEDEDGVGYDDEDGDNVVSDDAISIASGTNELIKDNMDEILEEIDVEENMR